MMRQLSLLLALTIVASLPGLPVSASPAKATQQTKASAGQRVADRILAPTRFQGYIRQAYQAAADNPALAEKLFCYCGCDQEAGHKHLIDCYRSDHAVFCGTCRLEMIRAAQYAKQGIPVAMIQKKIDTEFSEAYPFKHPSTALNNYNKSRSYVAGKAGNKRM